MARDYGGAFCSITGAKILEWRAEAQRNLVREVAQGRENGECSHFEGQMGYAEGNRAER